MKHTRHSFAHRRDSDGTRVQFFAYLLGKMDSEAVLTVAANIDTALGAPIECQP
jgi:hypothetical protein